MMAAVLASRSTPRRVEDVAGVQNDGVDAAELLKEHQRERNHESLDVRPFGERVRQRDRALDALLERPLDLGQFGLVVVARATQPHQRLESLVVEALPQAERRGLGLEGEQDDEDHREGGAEDGVGHRRQKLARQVRQEYADRHHELEVAAESPADLLLGDFAGVERGGDARRSGGHPSGQPPQVQHHYGVGEEDQGPAGRERNDQEEEGFSAADQVAQEACGDAHGHTPQSDERADPTHLVVVHGDVVEVAVLDFAQDRRRPAQHGSR
jgi:hypothetical protein